jgi:hypothetical protein
LKRPARTAVLITNLFKATEGQIRVPGSDEIANLSKESVKGAGKDVIEGIAQPLTQLGIIGLFYPFVAMGLTAVEKEYNETKEELHTLDQQKIACQNKIKQLNQQLHIYAPKAAALIQDAIDQHRRHKNPNIKKLKHQIQNASNSIFSVLNTHSETGRKELVSLLYQLNKLVLLHQKQKETNLKKREQFFDKRGLQGMLIALKLFIVYGATSLLKYLTSGQASTILSTFSQGFNLAGLSIMGISQIGIMASGIIKAASGLQKILVNKTKIGQLKYLAQNINDKEAKAALLRFRSLHKIYNIMEFFEKVGPGTILSIGQAELAAWSFAS